LSQDQERDIALRKQSTELGTSQAHYHSGYEYRQRGNLKKAKFHFEAAAMAGNEVARSNFGPWRLGV
jgi:TPR repeat protein